MKVAITEEQGRVVAKIAGDVDSNNATSVGEQLMSLVKAENPEVVVDLSEVDYITSDGLGQFVRMVVASRDIGSNVRFLSPQPFVRSIISATNLDQLLVIEDGPADKKVSADN